MRAIEQRFIGNAKIIKVVCSRCGASETINMHKDRPLPPNIIIKKLERSGWRLHNNADRDICKSCTRKPVASRLPLAEKALQDIARPMVANGKMHFSELEAICRTLSPMEARILIGVLRERIPARPKAERPPKPASNGDDSDYEQWLEQQEARST